MKDIKLGKLTIIARNGKLGYRFGDGQSHVLFGKNKGSQSADDEYDSYDDYDSYEDNQGRSRDDYYVDDYDDESYDDQEQSKGNILARSVGFVKDHKMPFITGGVAVAAVIALIAALNGGKNDATNLPTTMTLTSNLPTFTAQPTSTPDPDEGLVETDATAAPADATADPFGGDEFEIDDGDGSGTGTSATPLPGGSTSTDGDSLDGNVYSPQTGLYYHMDPNCSKIDAGVQVTLVTLQAAVNRNQSACPLCCGGTVYYARPDGKWYHTDRNCQGMTGATEYSKEAAIAEGKTACPRCAGGKEEDDSTANMTKGQRYLASLTSDKSGVKVWMTKKGEHYHAESDCSGMSGARQYTLLKAMQSGKTACPKCMANANIYVYCTSGGKYYHSKSACGSMKNGTKVTLALAKVLGKNQCPDCITEDFYKNADKASSNTTASPSSTKKPSSSGDDDNDSNKNGDGSEVYVYATESGNYYHTDSTCSSMKNAKKVTLKSMLKAGRKPCPKCCSTAGTTVYVTENGSYYHSYAGCSNIKNPKSGTLAQALAYGFRACPKCWGSGRNNNPTPTNDPDDGNSGYSDVYVYASESSRYYHVKKNCSKAPSDATKVLIELALDDGKQACPTCASTADKTVYAVKNGKYFHYDRNCGGMSGASSGTMAKALASGYKPCPTCVKKASKNTRTNGKYTSGTSGKKVYCSSHSRYYHTKNSCSSLGSTYAYVTLEAALNNGRSACPKCSSSASRKVYASRNGKYYHYSSSCAGANASSGKLDAALAAGYKPCPRCVSGTVNPVNSGVYTPGTSGIKVYVSKSNKHFHVKSGCSGMTNAQQVTLETALNYGYSGCPTCAKSANTVVYSLSGSSRFHLDKSCAGSAAKKGTLAQALALGLSPCTNCVLTDDYIDPDPIPDDDAPDDDIIAPGETSVYIDLSGDSTTYVYHKSSTCSKSGMKSGTKITLQYALDHDFTPCKHCKPATKIGL